VTPADLAKRVESGDRRSIARAITLVENDSHGASELLRRLSGKTGHAFVIGITGPPGTGKSTLVDRLIEQYRTKGLRLSVIAVDPTSPLTGGALLGDRVRMLRHSTDEGVFIRSMATRGWLGGLNRAIAFVVQILDAAGSDLILIETVGIGQADIEIMRIAHVVLVVLMPGMGDEVQASKAGLMEIGDIYLVNKSDLPGADLTMLSLLSVAREMKQKKPTILKISASKDEGIAKLTTAIEGLRAKFHSELGRQMKLESTKGMMVEIAKNEILSGFSERTRSDDVSKLAELVVDGKLDINRAAKKLIPER
jgi:LAO/AO transport system kinase